MGARARRIERLNALRDDLTAGWGTAIARGDLDRMDVLMERSRAVSREVARLVTERAPDAAATAIEGNDSNAYLREGNQS